MPKRKSITRYQPRHDQEKHRPRTGTIQRLVLEHRKRPSVLNLISYRMLKQVGPVSLAIVARMCITELESRAIRRGRSL